MLTERISLWRGAFLAALGTGLVTSCGGDVERGTGSGGSALGGASGGAAKGGQGGVGASGGAGGGVSAGAGGARGGEAGGGGLGEGGRIGVRTCSPIRTSVLGYAECEGGWLHRPSARTCASQVPRAGGAGGRGEGSSCSNDLDCTDAPYGFCFSDPFSAAGGAPSDYCRYGCTQDSDCGSASICVCGYPVGVCMRASCSTDADCEAGALCAGTPNLGGCGSWTDYAFSCQKPGDECATADDCGNASELLKCDVTPNGRVCNSSFDACGRPFLVHGVARQARSCYGATGWCEPRRAPSNDLPSVHRRELAEYWTRVGLMEHASVAAFARFALELLALGAPAELVEQTQRALGDEIAHTKLCFGLASRYAGRELGPRNLPLSGALEGRSSSVIVDTAILEACLGETLAAAEAAAALEQAQDEEVRGVLARIAEDEARHAELGFRFLSWVLSWAPPALREQALDTLFSAIERSLRECDAVLLESGADAGSLAADALQAHGLLDRVQRLQARKMALTEIVLPCALALRDGSLARVA